MTAEKCWTLQDPQGRLWAIYTHETRQGVIERDEAGMCKPWPKLRKLGFRATRVVLAMPDDLPRRLTAAQRALVSVADAVRFARDELAGCSYPEWVGVKRRLRGSTRGHGATIREAREVQS